MISQQSYVMSMSWITVLEGRQGNCFEKHITNKYIVFRNTVFLKSVYVCKYISNYIKIIDYDESGAK